jgi:glycosyltransferase involved in cell wall biosynthesis
MNIPVVSVVMSVFNGERFLREAVESILRQSFRDFEFIIIDDGSTDKSGSVLDSYQRSDARVRVLHQENRGLIDSLNRGCGLAQGTYIARMDADDIALDDRLMWQVERMEKNRALGLLGGAAEWIDATGKSLGIHRYPGENHMMRSALHDGSPFAHPTILMRREAFVSAGGYRPTVVDAEDYDLWLRIADRFELGNLQAVIVKYRIHPGQISERKCEQQALSSLAARAAARSRMNGDADPLDSVTEITPEVLERLGITQAEQRKALARHWLTCIRNMYDAGEYVVALRALETLRSHYLKYAENWVVCDFRLVEAQVFWDQGRYAKSVSKATRALIARPIVLGRPAKLVLRRVLGALHARQEVYGSELKKSRAPQVGL